MSRDSIISDTITSDDVLGKEVIDSEGEFIGIVEKLFLTKDVESVGISIDRGFFRKGLTIGKGYIERVTPYALFLNVRPSFLLKGLEIFDVEGSSIGRVADVVLSGKSNDIQYLIIHSLVGKSQTLSSAYISSIADGIFLNKKKSEIVFAKAPDELDNRD